MTTKAASVGIAAAFSILLGILAAAAAADQAVAA
jgi:hypothetical protein